MAVEYRGLKISKMKPVYLRFNGAGNLDDNSDINPQGENLERVTTYIFRSDIDREWTIGSGYDV